MTKIHIGIFKKNTLHYIMQVKVQLENLLHKLFYLYSDIFYSDLTLENAITIFASEKTNKEGVI